MAQLFSTGPALIYVGLLPQLTGSITGAGLFNRALAFNAGTAAFLGTATFAPEIVERPAWEPAFNDLGGTRIPFDQMYEGMEAFTFADMGRWNEPLMLQIKARPRSVFAPAANPQEGTNFAGDIGSFMIQEGLTFVVWVVFPYAQKAAYASMVPGYRFPFSYLMGPDEHKKLGTKPREQHIVFHHLRGFNPATGGFLTFDHNILGLPGIN